MKRNDLLLTLLSALLLALSRLPLHLGWLVFFAWLPLLRVFERGRASSRDLLRMGFIMSVAYCAIVYYWLVYVNPIDREILVLRFVAELEFQEIADIMHMGLSATKMRYKRALDKLREKFAGVAET